MNLGKALREDLGTKALAFLLALFIWFNATGQQEFTQTVEVPLQTVGLADTLALVTSLPEKARISVKATRRQLLYLRFRKAALVINLAGVGPGRLRQNLTTSNLVLPGRISPASVRILSPTFLDLRFERKIVRHVPVSITLEGALPGDLLLSEPARAVPPRVEVTGPESAVARLRAIPTEGIPLDRVRFSEDREVPLRFDRERILCTPDRVRVSLRVSPRRERTFPHLPPTLLNRKEGEIRVDPPTLRVVVEGPASLVDTLSSRDLSVLLDCSRLRPGSNVLVPELVLPEGVQSFRLEPDTVRVFWRPPSGSPR
jgi:YbbR domain-containing protein